MPSKGPTIATATPIDLELARADRDTITPSASSSLTPTGPISKAATPRRSLDIEESEPRYNATYISRAWSNFESGLPPRIRRYGRITTTWLAGPQPPRQHRIKPVFERVQTLPARLLGRLPGWARVLVYMSLFVVWGAVFGVVLEKGSLPANIGGWGAPVRVGCVANLWPSPQSCGLDGRNCLPFANTSFAFNCPADCLSAQVLNPRAIGNVSINYRQLVVGGQVDPIEKFGRVYRGDSFICGAAIHAGIIKNNQGGCGVVSLVGEKSNFEGVSRNGINSVPFDATFPMAFSFNQSRSVLDTSATCQDPRWNLLILSTIFTTLFGILTSHPATFFAPVFTILFFQVGMASDPPSYTTYASLASTILGRFLPAALAACLFYQFSVRKSLRGCTAHVEKTILWLGGAWVGALGNYTFDKIPIQRLTGHDIRQQPGAITALVIIILVLFGIILYQCWCLRLEGRLPRFLGLYALLGIGLGILAALPGLNLRIHHYILALLLLPGTSMQTRPSLLAQGLLVGLFVNGIARWGFDPILQTAAALRGDAQLGSSLPKILEPVVANGSISFVWEGVSRGWKGVSVLVNDVERFRGNGGEAGFTWNRTVDGEQGKEYFRFGFVSYLPFGGVSYSDFTRAGTWWANGTWSGIPPGRT
ncbi:LCCL domain-containing protein [Paraphoma chrysanthemicola]|uniref:LCCL domain-containing protein n=1 Tax=Paraphoma chrysanthemicola TaxID=798071 RepID=A0A8K0QSW3_9PLEO|nr:LCCL domain-containing protein [Paraphoma chrysanthemicola]